MLAPNRKRLLKLLDEEVSSRDKSVLLKVLHMGFGYEVELHVYHENSKTTVLEKNYSVGSYCRTSKRKCIPVEIDGIIQSMAENIKEISDNSVDVVVSTYVLCSVTDVARTLEDIKRVLKPGGKFFFLEHVIYEDFGWHYLLQRAISPLCRICFDGCEPDIEFKSFMDQAGFTRISYEIFLSKYVWLYLRSNFIGVATK